MALIACAFYNLRVLQPVHPTTCGSSSKIPKPLMDMHNCRSAALKLYKSLVLHPRESLTSLGQQTQTLAVVAG